MLGLGSLTALPADVVGALRSLPRLLTQIDAIARSTASLPDVVARLDAVVAKLDEVA